MFASVSISRNCGTNDGHDFSADFLCVNIIEYRAQVCLMPGFAHCCDDAGRVSIVELMAM